MGGMELADLNGDERLALVALVKATALAGRIPDVEVELIAPLAAEIELAYAEAEAAMARDELRAAMQQLLRQERIAKPLDGLAAAVAALSAIE